MMYATKEQIERAHKYFECDEIEIDDDALVSEAEGGVWVQGWLWVPDEDVG